MSALTVTVEARQRISMGRGAAKAFHTPSHAHIPGSVLRGAIARAWIDRHGTTDATFRGVFDGGLRFGPLFADGTNLRPLSVRSCKYGRAHCGASGTSPWYWDAAFPARDDVRRIPGWDSWHWVCGRGEVVPAPGSELPMTDVQSTAINHAKGAAAEGQLFSRGAIDTGTTFRGSILGTDEAVAVLANALIEHDRLELGGRSSVLGSARIVVTEGVEPQPPSTERVVVRLLSPAFLVDPAGRPSLDLGAELRRLQIKGGLEAVWTRPLTDGTAGFHAASRLPKPADIGLAAGTTAVLRSAEGDRDRIAALARHGVGLRRTEGFGWVAFAEVPWRMPVAADRPGAARPGPPDGGFDAARRQVRALDLDPDLARWLLARLREPLGTAERVAAALRQPGASALSDRQRDIVDVLLSEPFAMRRRLADALAERTER